MPPKVFQFPNESGNYLKTTYGLPKYSARHYKRLIKIGKHPTPFYLTPQRPVLTQVQLDEHAARVLAEISAHS
jgi:hypothetical protein